MRTMLKGKIHRARVTDANLDYEGSITIDSLLMELDIDNGARFETYAIEGERGLGEICINGAAARLVAKGDIVIILAYKVVSDEEARSSHPSLVYVDESNAPLPAGVFAMGG